MRNNKDNILKAVKFLLDQDIPFNIIIKNDNDEKHRVKPLKATIINNIK